MASGIYNRFKANLMNKVVDMEADTINVALMTSSHDFSSGSTTWAQVSGAQATGTGYVAGGTTLAGKAVTEAATTKWDATDVAWSGSTITARHAVIYDDTVTDDQLVCSFDFGEDKSSVSGTFTIQWHTDGIITLATA